MKGRKNMKKQKNKIKTFKVAVVWDTDGENVELPKLVEIPEYIKKGNYNIADYLSSNYGWCVDSYMEI